MQRKALRHVDRMILLIQTVWAPQLCNIKPEQGKQRASAQLHMSKKNKQASKKKKKPLEGNQARNGVKKVYL